MPAEWEPHEATWLVWPHNPNTWPGMLAEIPPIFSQMAAALSQGEQVCILIKDESVLESATRLLLDCDADLNQIEFIPWPSNDSWIRDSGPLFVRRQVEGQIQLAVTDWQFNMWGGKYPPWDLDNAIPDKVARKLALPRFKQALVMEGGSLDVNDQGVLLTTQSCLLNPNRNPSLSQEQIEQKLKDVLGVQQVLWLGEGIVGDDTDGHIDDLARFVNTSVIVCVLEQDASDPNHGLTQDNFKLLQRMYDPAGKPFNIVPLPMPKAVAWDGQRVPASYANFYIGNKVVLLPVFDDPQDARARAILQEHFPTRKVVAIPSRKLVWGLGACHCLTMQQPATDT